MTYLSIIVVILFFLVYGLFVSTLVRLKIFNTPYFGKRFSTQPDHETKLKPTKIYSHNLGPKTLTETWMGSFLVKLITKDTPGQKERKTFAHLYLPDSASKSNPAPLVVYTHGNGATIEEAMYWLDFLYNNGFSVLLPEYRGFGNAGGHPGRNEINSDLVWFYDQCINEEEIDTNRLYLYARSLGGGIACDLMAKRNFHKLILESTYNDIHEVVDKWYVPTLLMWDCRFNTHSLKDFSGQTLICHGTQDDVIEPWHAEKNLTLARNGSLKLFEANHANIYQREDYQKEVLNFLKT